MSIDTIKKKCVDCGQTGHTSAGCKNGKVDIFYLFGVMIDPKADADQSEDDDYVHVSSSNHHEAKSVDDLKMHNNVEHSLALDVTDEHDHDKKKGFFF